MFIYLFSGLLLFFVSFRFLLIMIRQMETINKLLKKQAPKTNRRAVGNETPGGGGEGGAEGQPRADPLLVRWISTKDGNRVAVPDEILAGPAGRVFSGGGAGKLGGGKMVEEVA